MYKLMFSGNVCGMLAIRTPAQIILNVNLVDVFRFVLPKKLLRPFRYGLKILFSLQKQKLRDEF